MKIDEAINILSDLDTTLPQSDPELRRQAVKLGIEALKWIKQTRYAFYPHHIPPLAGETEE